MFNMRPTFILTFLVLILQLPGSDALPLMKVDTDIPAKPAAHKSPAESVQRGAKVVKGSAHGGGHKPLVVTGSVVAAGAGFAGLVAPDVRAKQLRAKGNVV